MNFVATLFFILVGIAVFSSGEEYSKSNDEVYRTLACVMIGVMAFVAKFIWV